MVDKSVKKVKARLMELTGCELPLGINNIGKTVCLITACSI